jgi:hypothetical protein
VKYVRMFARWAFTVRAAVMTGVNRECDGAQKYQRF